MDLAQSSIAETLRPAKKLRRALMKNKSEQLLAACNYEDDDLEIINLYGGERGQSLEVTQNTSKDQKVLLTLEEEEEGGTMSNLVMLDKILYFTKVLEDWETEKKEVVVHAYSNGEVSEVVKIETE